MPSNIEVMKPTTAERALDFAIKREKKKVMKQRSWKLPEDEVVVLDSEHQFHSNFVAVDESKRGEPFSRSGDILRAPSTVTMTDTSQATEKVKNGRGNTTSGVRSPMQGYTVLKPVEEPRSEKRASSVSSAPTRLFTMEDDPAHLGPSTPPRKGSRRPGFDRSFSSKSVTPSPASTAASVSEASDPIETMSENDAPLDDGKSKRFRNPIKALSKRMRKKPNKEKSLGRSGSSFRRKRSFNRRKKIAYENDEDDYERSLRDDIEDEDRFLEEPFAIVRTHTDATDILRDLNQSSDMKTPPRSNRSNSERAESELNSETRLASPPHSPYRATHSAVAVPESAPAAPAVVARKKSKLKLKARKSKARNPQEEEDQARFSGNRFFSDEKKEDEDALMVSQKVKQQLENDPEDPIQIVNKATKYRMKAEKLLSEVAKSTKNGSSGKAKSLKDEAEAKKAELKAKKAFKYANEARRLYGLLKNQDNPDDMPEINGDRKSGLRGKGRKKKSAFDLYSDPEEDNIERERADRVRRLNEIALFPLSFNFGFSAPEEDTSAPDADDASKVSEFYTQETLKIIQTFDEDESTTAFGQSQFSNGTSSSAAPTKTTKRPSARRRTHDRSLSPSQFTQYTENTQNTTRSELEARKEQQRKLKELELFGGPSVDEPQSPSTITQSFRSSWRNIGQRMKFGNKRGGMMFGRDNDDSEDDEDSEEWSGSEDESGSESGSASESESETDVSVDEDEYYTDEEDYDHQVRITVSRDSVPSPRASSPNSEYSEGSYSTPDGHGRYYVSDAEDEYDEDDSGIESGVEVPYVEGDDDEDDSDDDSDDEESTTDEDTEAGTEVDLETTFSDGTSTIGGKSGASRGDLSTVGGASVDSRRVWAAYKAKEEAKRNKPKSLGESLTDWIQSL